MSHYKADLGSWEKGRCVKFEAENHMLAVCKAGSMINDSDGFDAEVVQVKVKTENGYVCIYDFMNGIYGEVSPEGAKASS